MLFNRILFNSVKNKLYFQNNNYVISNSVLPYLKMRYLYSEVNERDKKLLQKTSKKNKNFEKSNDINKEKIDYEEMEDENTEMEYMFCETSSGREWGGPMRGGRFYEPTRFGDWERKGRCTDF